MTPSDVLRHVAETLHQEDATGCVTRGLVVALEAKAKDVSMTEADVQRFFNHLGSRLLEVRQLYEEVHQASLMEAQA